MKRLEKMRLKMPEPRDAERLARWLYEWELLQAAESDESGKPAEAVYPSLLEKDAVNNSDEISAVERCVAAFDRKIEAGQIRLTASGSGDSMVFIAVAAVEPDGAAVCVPFGVLAEPATPDELLSGLDSDAVAVYCLWNTRRLPSESVSESWIADRLDASGLDRLLLAVTAIESGKRLPKDLLADCGPPLIHPDDPRREYKRWERKRINRAFAGGRSSAKNIISYDINSEQQEFLKAAEPNDDYDT